MNEPIRVAQIMGKLWAGGVEMVVFNYYRAIDKSKVQFDFYYDADSTVEPPQDLIDMGARFIKVPPYQRLTKYLKTLKKHFKENNYKIVHSHINTLSVFPLYMAWRCGIPVRIAHNHSVPGGESLKRTGLKYFLKMFARVFATDYFACSEKAGRWLFGDKNYESGRVTVIKNAVDFNRFRPSIDILTSLRNRLKIENAFVVGCIGRFTFAKNHFFLIDTFEEVKKRKNDAILLLVGDGELHDEIQKYVEERNLKEYVRFAGQVSDPENYYKLCNVVAVPSIFEGLSLTTIEAQVAGVQVIISNAIPDEAIISDACKRVDLKKQLWTEHICTLEPVRVQLKSNSKEYDITLASEKLCKYYLGKVK